MSDYGMKVTRSGYDVASAGLLNQEFNSEHNCLKMMGISSITSTNTGFRDVVVTHSLGYKPAFLAFFEVSGNGRWYAMGAVEDYSGGACRISYAYADDTYLTFTVYSSNSKTIKVAYRLFVDPGE